jgi:hypothetical protein
LNLNLLPKVKLVTKIPFTSFPSCLVENIWVGFAFPYALMPRHDWAKQDTIWVIRGIIPSYQIIGSCVNLSNEKQEAICTSCYKAIGMWLYSQGQWRPKWEDSMTSNVEIQAHAYVGGVGARDGIEPKWS